MYPEERMCCHTNQCCCGCTDMKSGIAIAAIFDVFLYMILGTLNVIFLHNYGAFWGVIVVVADMLLICGVMGKNTGLLIIWMIITMINIVFLFIGWLALPLIILFGGFCSKMSDNEEFWYESNTDFYTTTTRTICGDTIQIGLIVTAVFVFILPVYYLYFWIVVKSHRENLVREQSAVLPLPRQPGPPMFVVANGMVPQRQKIIEPLQPTQSTMQQSSVLIMKEYKPEIASYCI